MRVYLILLVSILSACSSFESIKTNNSKPSNKPSAPHAAFCSNEWFQYVEGQLNTGDNQGHGPDVGSFEWQAVVEFKLDLLKHPTLPPKSSARWCDYIQQTLDKRRKIPTLSCHGKIQNAIAQVICSQSSLVALDNELNTIFKTVLAKRSAEKRADLKAEQRAWFETRDQCLKHTSKLLCIRHAYQYRIAQLQTRYGLIEGLGPIYYVCDGQLSDEVSVTFYPTELPSLIAEKNGQVSFMTQQISASGTKYQGQNEIFWEHQGKAYITWGAGSSLMDCKKMH